MEETWEEKEERIWPTEELKEELKNIDSLVWESKEIFAGRLHPYLHMCEEVILRQLRAHASFLVDKLTQRGIACSKPVTKQEFLDAEKAWLDEVNSRLGPGITDL